jgi:hypothetical protein
MHWLRLDCISPEKQAMRAKAKRALLRFTGTAIDTLRQGDEEFLQGEWAGSVWAGRQAGGPATAAVLAAESRPAHFCH